MSKHLNVHHIAHYLTIVTIAVVMFTVTIILPFSKEIRFGVVVLGCLLYAGYGIYHHHRMHDITIKIVVEYILVSLLALALFQLVLLGGVS